MKKVYDWETNRIEFDDKDGNIYNLQLRGNVNIVVGDSASGKTLLCNKIMNIARDKNIVARKYSADDMFVVNEDNVDKLKENNHTLILIDRAEQILDDDLVDYINRDISNRYLIFTRKSLGIEITPNHVAEMREHDREFRLEYRYNVGGWC